MARYREDAAPTVKKNDLKFFNLYSPTYYTPKISKCWDSLHPRHPYSGGDGVIEHTTESHISWKLQSDRWPGGVYNYEGGSMLSCRDPGIYLHGDKTVTNLQPYVTEGHARTKPGRPQVGLGVGLGELRDLPRLLHSRFLKLARTKYSGLFEAVYKGKKIILRKELAAAYLEWKFGWQQLLRDMQGLYTTWHSLDRSLQQLLKDAGKPVRRRVQLRQTFDNLSWYDNSNMAGFSPVTAAIVWAGNHERISFYSLSNNIHYVGQFSYSFPLTGEGRFTRKSKLALFGLTPTPSVLWNVMPWTWLTDWFLGIGRALERVEANAVNDLRTKYQYAVSEWTESVTSTSRGTMLGKAGHIPVTATVNRSVRTYKRQGESLIPFANLLPTDIGLSVYQLAIIAALSMR